MGAFILSSGTKGKSSRLRLLNQVDNGFSISFMFVQIKLLQGKDTAYQTPGLWFINLLEELRVGKPI